MTRPPRMFANRRRPAGAGRRPAAARGRQVSVEGAGHAAEQHEGAGGAGFGQVGDLGVARRSVSNSAKVRSNWRRKWWAASRKIGSSRIRPAVSARLERSRTPPSAGDGAAAFALRKAAPDLGAGAVGLQVVHVDAVLAEQRQHILRGADQLGDGAILQRAAQGAKALLVVGRCRGSCSARMKSATETGARRSSAGVPSASAGCSSPACGVRRTRAALRSAEGGVRRGIAARGEGGAAAVSVWRGRRRRSRPACVSTEALSVRRRAGLTGRDRRGASRRPPPAAARPRRAWRAPMRSVIAATQISASGRNIATSTMTAAQAPPAAAVSRQRGQKPPTSASHRQAERRRPPHRPA